MSTMNIVGQDAITINGRILSDFPHGEIGKLEFPTDIMTMKTGKNGNVIVASNQSGRQATLDLRVLRGSGDDAFLNNLLSTQQAGFTDPSGSPTFGGLVGTFTKMIGNDAGKMVSDKYALAFGAFKKLVPVVSNVEGDVEQAVVSYNMEFASVSRAIG